VSSQASFAATLVLSVCHGIMPKVPVMLLLLLASSTVLLMPVHLTAQHAVLQATDHEPVWRQILQHHLD
jgi:hypothetical protein